MSFPCQPRCRIQFCLFFPKLEMQDGGVIVFRIRKDFSDGLSGIDFVSCLDIYLTQITVDGKVIAMPDNDRVIIARNHEDSGNLSIEYGTGICPRRSLDINTVVICPDILQFLMLLLTKPADNRMGAGHRIGEKGTSAGVPFPFSPRWRRRICRVRSAFVPSALRVCPECTPCPRRVRRL